MKFLDDCANPIRLYASALQRVDEKLRILDKQDFKHLKLTIEAEFMRHRLAGCSFVFSSGLYEAMKDKYESSIKCSHDKLITIMCMLLGGEVIFDSESKILFRRYGDNTSSDGKGIFFKIYDDVKKRMNHRNQESMLALSILNFSHIDNGQLHSIEKIANYRTSLYNTFRLLMDKNMNCGFWYYNFWIRLLILLRVY